MNHRALIGIIGLLFCGCVASGSMESEEDLVIEREIQTKLQEAVETRQEDTSVNRAGCGIAGSASYCSASCQCVIGGGDCDTDDDCAPGLYCATDVGADWGYAAAVDVCLELPGCHQSRDGSYDFCTVDCPCEVGQGDCDSDEECLTGTYCAVDVGSQYGYSSITDVCVNAMGCHSGILGGASFCSPSCPCSEGQGDCDSDYECEPGLYCATDIGSLFGLAPVVDVCQRYDDCHQDVEGGASYCSTDCPCAENEGDCDGPLECQNGMYCLKDVGANYGYASTVDVCSPCQSDCREPPPAACSGNEIVSYAQGTCNALAKSCVFPTTTSACLYGCYAAACTGPLEFLGNRAAFESDTGMPVGLTGGVASSAGGVSVIVQTRPKGAIKVIELFYTTDGFATIDAAIMSFDFETQDVEQWYAIIPAQGSSVTVTWYLRAEGYDGAVLWDSNYGANYWYVSQ